MIRRDLYQTYKIYYRFIITDKKTALIFKFAILPSIFSKRRFLGYKTLVFNIKKTMRLFNTVIKASTGGWTKLKLGSP